MVARWKMDRILHSWWPRWHLPDAGGWDPRAARRRLPRVRVGDRANVVPGRNEDRFRRVDRRRPEPADLRRHSLDRPGPPAHLGAAGQRSPVLAARVGEPAVRGGTARSPVQIQPSALVAGPWPR